MAGVKVSLNGISKLDAGLERIKDINPALIAAINKCTGLVSGRAKNRCPTAKEGGGQLKNSIHMHPADVRNGNEVVGIVYTALEYASYVEFGTGSVGSGTYPYAVQNITLTYEPDSWVYTPDGGEHFYRTNGYVAKPFLMPALLESKTQINNIVSDAVITAVRKGN